MACEFHLHKAVLKTPLYLIIQWPAIAPLSQQVERPKFSDPDSSISSSSSTDTGNSVLSRCAMCWYASECVHILFLLPNCCSTSFWLILCGPVYLTAFSYPSSLPSFNKPLSGSCYATGSILGTGYTAAKTNQTKTKRGAALIEHMWLPEWTNAN